MKNARPPNPGAMALNLALTMTCTQSARKFTKMCLCQASGRRDDGLAGTLSTAERAEHPRLTWPAAS